MRVIERAVELSATLDEQRSAGRTVGFVPTMGALHDGHASLIERAAVECDTVAVSIFVNPLQFVPGEDLAEYPRDLGADLVVAEKAGAAVVFAPTATEMFPDASRTTVHVAGLGDVLEGASRPGHFDGVATAVTKLLALAGRSRSYFGEKDFQQLVVVGRLVADLSLPVEVVACPTVRGSDGVALSSRNRYLSVDEREAAAVLHRALRAGAACVRAGERDPGEVVDLVSAVVEAEPLVTLDYAAVVDPATLATPRTLAGELRLVLGARVGATRLIDNVAVEVPR
ncbi:MAG: pantoate--beta-alanine ligase [Actinobacteria bacterium]|nr:pantoate--beta-alanine ligase [Actinomycetota bacterium]